MSLEQLVHACQFHPELLHVKHDHISLYISLVRHLRPTIEFAQASTYIDAPQGLPIQIHKFLQHSLNMDDCVACICWTALKDIAWDDDGSVPVDLATIIPLFLMHGIPLDLGRSFYMNLVALA